MSDYVYFKGKGNYCKFVNPDQKFQKWGCDLYFDETSLDTFKELKLKTHLRKDDDGYYAKITRPVSKKIGLDQVAFLPPKVFDKDNKPLEGVLIGNGSDLTLKCEVYKYTPPGAKARENAIRLESVRVDHLIPYTPKKDFTSEEARAMEGLEDQPAPLF